MILCSFVVASAVASNCDCSIRQSKRGISSISDVKSSSACLFLGIRTLYEILMLFLGIGFGISRYCFSWRCFCRDFCSFSFAVFSAIRSLDFCGLLTG